LLVARYFLPAESAALGETLWLVQAGLLVLSAWLALLARGDGLPRAWDAVDFGRLLLVGGHMLSALAVISTGEGDRRAALNMLWEWVGIGLMSLWLADVARSAGGRRTLAAVVVCSAVLLSGLGLWQHYVWYPRIAQQLAELDRLRSDAAAQGLSPMQSQRLRELESQLGPVSRTGSRTASALLRDRVAASTEPIGRFALANTLAGLLLVAVLVAWGSCHLGWRRHGLLLVMLGILMDCLWLTKSRTAWIGLACGGLSGWFLTRRAVISRWQRWGIGLILAALLLGLPLFAGLTGSLDRAVISETPKSLQYRLEYWSATLPVIRAHLWLGVGPGNFRQHYLQHKLPGSSEEVSDPHNLFLDVWANGGLLALAGLVVVLWSGVASATPREAEEADRGEASVPWPTLWLHLGGIGSLGLVLAGACGWLFGSEPGAELVWLLVGWWLVTAVWSWAEPADMAPPWVQGAFLGLTVHLTGAGGIGMPVVALTWLLLASLQGGGTSLRAGARAAQSASASLWQTRWRWAAVWGGLAATIACAVTATIPVTTSSAQLRLAESALVSEGHASRAEQLLLRAVDDDPWNPDTWEQLAVTRLAVWMQTNAESAFDGAIAAQREAISRDPHSAVRWRTLGMLWSRRHEQTGHADDARQALAAVRQAVARYPHLVDLQAELAVAAWAAGDEQQAREAARRALDLDRLNTERMHFDKALDQPTRDRLQRLVLDSDTGAPA
jgi:hypothetical protein